MSPMVATYDQPAMSAEAVTDVVTAAIQNASTPWSINYITQIWWDTLVAYQLRLRTVETVDRCLGRLLESASSVGVRQLLLPTTATQNL